MMVTNSSKTPTSFSSKLSQSEHKKWHTSVAFSNTFQACHAVALPFPTNADKAIIIEHAWLMVFYLSFFIKVAYIPSPSWIRPIWREIGISLILANSQMFCDNVLYPDFARLFIGGDLSASHLSP